MKTYKHLIIIALAIALGGCDALEIQPTEPQPVVNIKHAKVSKAETPVLTREQIEDAIIEAAASQGWQVDPARTGLFIASRQQDDKEAIIDILYGTKVYSINYQSSENLNSNAGLISPSYNHWIKALNGAIRAKLVAVQKTAKATEVAAVSADAQADKAKS